MRQGRIEKWLGPVAFACGMVAATGLAQIPGVVEFEDVSGSRCNLVNAENAQLVVIEAEGDFPRQLALVTGEDQIIGDSFIDEDLSVFFGDTRFGAIRFVEDGDGLATLWWVDAIGNALAIDPITLIPEATDVNPTTRTDVQCDACFFWDNVADCPGFGEPTIVEQPTDQTACVGDKVTLSVGVTGQGIEGYQWFKNGVELVGKVNAVLTINKVTVNDTANYTVEVLLDNGDSLTSRNARLLVNEGECEEPTPGLNLCGGGLASVMPLMFLGLVGLRRRR